MAPVRPPGHAEDELDAGLLEGPGDGLRDWGWLVDQRLDGHARALLVRYGTPPRPYTDTCVALVAVKGSRFQPPQRAFRRRPAMRAMRSSSLGHA